ncbi:MAG: hypothetical protein EBV84_09835 [Betaproteobacteria bacterium]|nr:hypothetical protein [Betaproteobacteria bacterium]
MANDDFIRTTEPRHTERVQKFLQGLMEAQEAMAIGLLTEVVPNVADLMPRARALAEQLAGHAPLTMMACKEALRRMHAEGLQADDHDLVMRIYGSEDFREGMDAFLEKRTPRWQGR